MRDAHTAAEATAAPPDTSARRSARNRALGWAGVAVMVTSFFFVGRAVVMHWQSLPAIHWTAQRGAIAALTVAGSCLAMAAIGLAYGAILRALGQPADHPAVRIYLLSQALKYLPGNVAHLAGRVAMSKKAGVPVTTASMAVLIETAWLALTAAIVGGLGFAIFAPLPYASQWIGDGLSKAMAWIGAIAACAGIGAIIVVQRRHAAHRSRPALRWLLVAAGWSLAYFIVMGLCAAGLGIGILGIGNGRDVFVASGTITATYAIAWVAGTITPGAPGGLGVREAVLIALLDSALGPQMAISLALWLRAQSLIAETIVVVVALGWRQVAR